MRIEPRTAQEAGLEAVRKRHERADDRPPAPAPTRLAVRRHKGWWVVGPPGR